MFYKLSSFRCMNIFMLYIWSSLRCMDIFMLYKLSSLRCMNIFMLYKLSSLRCMDRFMLYKLSSLRCRYVVAPNKLSSLKDCVCAIVANTSLTPFSEPSEWKLHSTSTLWSGLERCWKDEVYLPSLLHRFWKLSLQQMARHATWLDQIYDDEVSWGSRSKPTKGSKQC